MISLPGREVGMISLIVKGPWVISLTGKRVGVISLTRGGVGVISLIVELGEALGW